MKVIPQVEMNKGFNPITVTIVIESQEEYDALEQAGGCLIDSEIDAMYSKSYRDVWVRTLEVIAGDMV